MFQDQARPVLHLPCYVSLSPKGCYRVELLPFLLFFEERYEEGYNEVKVEDTYTFFKKAETIR